MYNNNLREKRLQAGLKISELVRAANVCARTISDIEKGKRRGNEVTRRKILNGLNSMGAGYTYEDIWGQEE